jgi:hypothetical protein
MVIEFTLSHLKRPRKVLVRDYTKERSPLLATGKADNFMNQVMQLLKMKPC